MAELEMKAPARSYARFKVMARSSIRPSRRLPRELRDQESGLSVSSRDFWRAAALSLVFLAVLLGVWHLATLPRQQASAANDEYAKLMGKGAKKTEGLPTPAQIGETAWKHLADPFYDRGSNDKGIGIQLAYSLARVGLGYALAILFAVPLGFLIGMSRSCTARSIPSSGAEADFAARLDCRSPSTPSRTLRSPACS